MTKRFKIKSLIAKILIVAMVLCNTGFYTFADSVENMIAEGTDAKEKQDYSIFEGDNIGNNIGDNVGEDNGKGSEDERKDSEGSEYKGEDKGSDTQGEDNNGEDNSGNAPQGENGGTDTAGPDSNGPDSGNNDFDKPNGGKGNDYADEPEGDEPEGDEQKGDKPEGEGQGANSTGLGFELSGEGSLLNQGEEVPNTFAADYEAFANENAELLELLNRYDLTIDTTEKINLLKEIQVSETEDYLVADFNDGKYLLDDSFLNKYGVKNTDRLMGGYGDPASITINFGSAPLAANSTDWTGSAYTTNTVITWNGNQGQLITDVADTTGLPISDGCIKLPNFNNSAWNGFKFDGWVDSKGYTLAGNKLLPSFQYDSEANETYTAKWSRDTTMTKKIKISYKRYVPKGWLSSPATADTTEEGYDLITSFEENSVNHGDNFSKDAEFISGYSISEVIVRIDSETGDDKGAEGLKEIDYTGNNFLSFGSDDMTLDGGNNLSGCMPNHDLYIEYKYTPNTTTSMFRVSFTTSAGDELRADDAQNCLAESIVTYTAPTITNYVYDHSEILTGAADKTDGTLALGDFHVEDEMIVPSTIDANSGAFKGRMPNQEVYLIYYYKLGDMDTEVYIQKETEKDDGTYDIATTPVTVTVGADHQHTATISNLKNRGYGTAIVTARNVMIKEYVAEGGIGGADGYVKYTIESDKTPVLIISYSLDVTSAYWTKLGYYAKDAASGGHGTIGPAPQSKPLTERYIKKCVDPGETYTLAQLTANVIATPNENYKCVWYMKATSDTEKTGDPLPETGISVTGTNFNLFASFEEDPDKWIDVKFENTDNCSLSGTSTFHMLKNTARTAITFPTVVVQQGYVHRQDAGVDRWVNKDTGAVLGDTFTETATYRPAVEASFTGDPYAVKPITYVTYDGNGVGTANLYGTYPDRAYVLADHTDKILKKVKGENVAGAFTGLKQGMTYHMYEALNWGAVPATGSNISTSAPNISDKYVFGVKALNGNYTFDQANETITITPRAGVTYAILDDRYTEVSGWTTTPTFTGLTKGTYYLVVAKDSADTTLTTTSDDVIRNGQVFYTEENDLSTRQYKLVTLGAANVTQGGGTVHPVTGANVYYVSPGTTVKVRSQNNYRTYCVTNNVNLNESALENTFSMPSQDVVITAFATTETDRNKISINTNGANVSLADIQAAFNTLNSETRVAQALADNCTVFHNININKYATNKATVQGLAAGKVAPYEYTIDIVSVVLGLPYQNPNISSVNLQSHLALDKEMIGNKSYALNFGAMSCIYTTDERDIGLATMNLNLAQAISVNYIKQHKVDVTCTTTGIEFEGAYYVNDGNKLTTADNYTELSAKLVNVFDNPTVPADAKEYICDGLKQGTTDFDIANTDIKEKKSLTLNYHLNEDREATKSILTTEIALANDKLNSLTNDGVKAILQAAINTASAIRADQKNKTVAELYAAYETLKAAKEAAEDPSAAEGDDMTVTLDGNGGTLSQNSITIIVGDAYTYDALASVTGSRAGYTLASFNTQANGTGTSITAASVVGTNPSTVLYAIWQATGGGGGSSSGGYRGGGGGGGGGRPMEHALTENRLLAPLNNGLTGDGFSISKGETPFYGNSMVIDESDTSGVFYLFEPATNKLELKVGNKSTLESIANQWVIVHIGDNKYKTYKTDANGSVVAGKFADDMGNVYYINETPGLEYGSLQTGWIQDLNSKFWYYVSPKTGTIVTGWQSIDGKDYYFYKPDGVINSTVTTANSDNMKIYGAMLAGVQTWDGYTIDNHGERVETKPYNFRQQ